MIHFLLHTLKVSISILESKLNPTPETGTIQNTGQPNCTFLTSEDLPPLKFLTSQNDYEAHIGTKMDYNLFNSF